MQICQKYHLQEQKSDKKQKIRDLWGGSTIAVDKVKKPQTIMLPIL